VTKILLIDDEPATRLVMQNRLKELGFDVVTAESGAKGLLEARESAFDLILVDADLGAGVNGYEVCRRLKQAPQTAAVPLILLSKQSGVREDLRRGYEAGCEAFLQKSDLAILEDVVRVLLRFRAQQDDLALQNRALEEKLRRTNEERLRASEGEADPAQAWRELACGRPDGMLLVDAEGIVRYADRGARDLFGNALEGKNLGRLAPATGLEAFVRDARTDARDGFRFDLTSRGRAVRSLSSTVVPLVANPGEIDPGLRVVLLLDASKRRLASEILRLQESTIPRREIGVLLDAARVAFGPASLLGTSAAMARVRAQISEAARSGEPALLTGEPGTGKQHAARALHFGGESSGPFLPVHCAGLSPENLESELFGTLKGEGRKGSSTEARSDRPGLFQQANHGTVFLEDIDRLPPALQPKLLRVLQEHQVCRAGSEKQESVEARVVASTYADLSELAKSGAFAAELFDCLRGIEIHLPPLRERREDVPVLAQNFLSRYGCGREGLEISDRALWTLENYDWPGNVRELAACIERACVQAQGELIDVEHLPAPLRELFRSLPSRDLVPSPRPTRVAIGGTHTAVEEHAQTSARAPEQARTGAREPWEIGPEEPVSLDLYEKKALLRALEETGGDKLAAARLLKVGKSTLYRKLKRYGIN